MYNETKSPSVGLKSKILRLIGYALIAIILYVAACFVLISVAFTANQSSIVVKVWPISSYQRYLYYTYRRNIWQYYKNCINVDVKLIYSPSHGTCEFNNIEFNTILNFDSLGRFVPARAGRSPNKGIAILGDSQAMGWGVNDDETFANVLQKNTEKPVFNLAVSSYGTVREIRRLIETNLINELEIIIIQYHSNDIGENSLQSSYQIIKFGSTFFTVENDNSFEVEANKFANHLKYMIEPNQRSLANHLAPLLTKKAIEEALKIPWQPIRSALSQENFVDFVHQTDLDFEQAFYALKNVIERYREVLEDKRVIIFYSNSYGVKFKNFEDFSFGDMENIKLVDLSIPREMYFFLDDHLTANGHQFVGQELAKLID